MDMARRSSRANRASQTQSASQHSSSSSNASVRADRTTRSNNKAESPGKSTASGSLSSEPPDDTVATVEDTIQTRRKRGRAEEQRDKKLKSQISETGLSNGVDEVGEDDEAVRCICGFEEYPGPPRVHEVNKVGTREDVEDPLISVGEVTEDLAGFFLQCDICKVWQHGGCVGIMNEDTSPEEYFCEKCRNDLHRVFNAMNGQRYSHYLPLHQSVSQTSSRAASFSKDGTRSPRISRTGRLSSTLQSANGKRRSTMNSRDAAYDEEEQLRRAIEASKGRKSAESTDGGMKRGKRSRSDSEEKPDGPKRQRTVSASPSPSGEYPRYASQPESDEGSSGRNTCVKKIRGAAAKNHKEKDLREEREKLRLEAASKRNGRAERRRVDGSDPLEELLPANNAECKITEIAPHPPELSISSQVTAPDTPPIVPATIPHRKGGRPPNARKGKQGRNQYTRDRDLQDQDSASPHRSQSRDVAKGDDSLHSSGNKALTGEVRIGRSKGGYSKITMSDMRRRANIILDFITRTQLELAGEGLPTATTDRMRNLARAVPAGSFEMQVNGGDDYHVVGNKGDSVLSKEFKDLSCRDMMDDLTKQVIQWQKQFS